MDALGQALFISVADIPSAFWQLPVAEDTSTLPHSSLLPASAVLNERRLECLKRRGFFNTLSLWLYSRSPWS